MALELFNEPARRVVVIGQEEARLLNHNYYGTEHLLLGLTYEENAVSTALAQLGMDLSTGRQLVEQIIGMGRYQPVGHIAFTPRMKAIIERHALAEAHGQGLQHIAPEHLLLGILREGDGVAVQVLKRAGVDMTRLRTAVSSASVRHNALSQLVETSRPSALAEFAVPQERVRGRHLEIQRAAQVLARHSRSSLVLVGEPGVGRRTVVVGLAQELAGTAVVPALRDRRLHVIVGDIREALTELAGPESIVYLDDVDSASGELREAVIDGSVQLVCVATPASLALLDRRFAQRLQPVRIEEMSVPATVEVLDGVRDRMQDHHQLLITDDALGEVARLAGAHSAAVPLPGKAIDLLDEVCARSRPLRFADDQLDEQLAEVRQTKERAIDAQGFDLAGRWRSVEKELLLQRANGATPTVTVVTALAVQRVVRDIAEESYSPQAPAAPEPEVVPDPFARSGADLWMIS